MEYSSFGFDVNSDTSPNEINIKETQQSVIEDIKSYWGNECFSTSSSFTLTIL